MFFQSSLITQSRTGLRPLYGTASWIHKTKTTREAMPQVVLRFSSLSCHVAAIPPLLSDSELCNHLPVAIDVIHSEVIEQTPALTDDLQQPAPGPMIFFVRFEVPCPVGNAFAKQSDLNFRGPFI